MNNGLLDEKTEERFPQKKYIDHTKNKNDIQDKIRIKTNLTKLELNKEAINDIYIYGCGLSEEFEPTDDFNAVNIMRKTRRLKCFQDKIKQYIENYYISGLVLIGKPKNPNNKIFKFYLKVDKSKEFFDGEIFEDLSPELKNKENNTSNDNIRDSSTIYKFQFKKKKETLLEISENKNSEEVQFVAQYLNICLGKNLKKCDYIKDRTSSQNLYYQSKGVQTGKYLGSKKEYLYFPALKAVCGTYEGGNIYLKLLPKTIIKSNKTFRNYFDDIVSNDIEERLTIFKKIVLNKKGMAIHNQVMIKIDDIIFENPYNINFIDKAGKNWNVGNYLTRKFNIRDLNNEKMPIAVRIIDNGGKLKGNDRKYIHIPCQLLVAIGNIFGDKINIKKLIQKPNQKFNEIEKIRKLIEEMALDPQNDGMNKYLGDKFDPVTIEGEVIKPPLILFGNNKINEFDNGSFDLRETNPYNKIKEMNKIDIYTYGLDKKQYEKIWRKIEEASIKLGIKFKEKPTFNKLDAPNQKDLFQKYLEDYFGKLNDYYSGENCKTDFIFFFMDKKYQEQFHYNIFKSVINKYDWCIPTQVVIYDKDNINKDNLTKFTNILCQMLAKKGNELYICDFSFVPNTVVIAYSSSFINSNCILTSIAISVRTKLYDYKFYSKKSDSKDKTISPTLYSLLYKALKHLGKDLKEPIKNIVIYRGGVSSKQQNIIREIEIPVIKRALKELNKKFEREYDINPFKETKWILILVSKMNDIKMFLEGQDKGNNSEDIRNVPVGTLVDRVITNQNKYDFYLNSAESRQGTCNSTHYIILHDDTELSASQIYKLTYYLTFLSYSTTKSIRIPSPLYFVLRRNQFTIAHLNGELINEKSKQLNISL